MSHRDFQQLTKFKLLFCDWGGSSKGIREFINSNNFYDFVNNNKNVNFDFLVKRGGHPFIRAIYANGFKRDIPLRNKTINECLEEFKTTTKLIGRKALNHNGPKVFGSNQSVQGLWKSNMFNTPPSHGILEFKGMPEYPFKESEIAPEKPYVVKELPKTWTRKSKNHTKIPNI